MGNPLRGRYMAFSRQSDSTSVQTRDLTPLNYPSCLNMVILYGLYYDSANEIPLSLSTVYRNHSQKRRGVLVSGNGGGGWGGGRWETMLSLTLQSLIFKIHLSSLLLTSQKWIALTGINCHVLQCHLFSRLFIERSITGPYLAVRNPPLFTPTEQSMKP